MISVICPSRGRPGNAERLISAWRATTVGAAMLTIVVDLDDPERDGYHRLNQGGRDGTAVIFQNGGGGGLVAPLNDRARIEAIGGTRHIGFVGDDHLPLTPGWDDLVAEALVTPGAIVYGDDRFQGPNLPTAVFMDAVIVRALGYMVPPTLRHMYADDLWKRWGEELGTLRYLPEVQIEHLHPHAGKGTVDETYERVWPLTDGDAVAFRTYCETELGSDVAKIRAVLP